MMECRYRPVERIGLYIMVILILLQTCARSDDYDNTARQLDRIEEICAAR